MAIKIRVPGALRQLTRGAAIVEVDAGDVSQALDELNEKYPGFRERLYDDKGELRQFINIYRNDEDIRFGSGLKTPLKDSDDLSIVPAVAGADAPVARTTVRLTFRGDTLNDPIIYRLGQEFKVVTNIRRADVAEDSGWVELDLDGEPPEVERALEYCRGRGIGVQRLEPA